MKPIGSAFAAGPILTNLPSGKLSGESVVTTTKTIGDLTGYWHDAVALERIDQAIPLYATETWFPVDDGTEGAVLWGNTTLFPGRVGDEYFMTRGHWHRKRDRGELVVCVSGHGALVLMNEGRETRMERLSPGSTHYVPGHTAHRTVNTGQEPLVFLCAWPADCGHDYDDILERGFSRLLLDKDGTPNLVAPHGEGRRQKAEGRRQALIRCRCMSSSYFICWLSKLRAAFCLLPSFFTR